MASQAPDSKSRSQDDKLSEHNEEPTSPDVKQSVGEDREKLEVRMNIVDFKKIMEMFSEEEELLSLTREQFIEAMVEIGATGTKEEFGGMFDRMDITKEGEVNWDKFASHMLSEFYEKDDKVKSTQVPHWSDLKVLSTSVHKDIIQGVNYLKSNNRFIAISKEGSITLWSPELRLQRSLRTSTEACRTKDLWVTSFAPLPPPINKIALAFTSKEIAIYDMSSKIDFNSQYKIVELNATPLCMHFWLNPSNPNDAIIVWGDVSGCVNALNFSTATIALFERPAAPAGGKQDPCLTVKLADIQRGMFKNVKFTKHSGHTEWVRQVKYCHGLECFLSCATTYNNSIVIGWLEKDVSNMKTSKFQITQGINAFDFHPGLNLIASAGVNHQVCLWNPYVVSKPNGILRGHMATVVQVQFIGGRNQLLSFSKDKVLRLWDVGLQVCIQRLAGMFPKGGEVQSIMYFDELRSRLFITFNYQLCTMSVKAENKDKVQSHEKPVVAVLYNETYNQIVSVDQGGTMAMWRIDSGQRIKGHSKIHGNAVVTALSQDSGGTQLYSGATDGTIKIWDFNGHCYHTLHCSSDDSVDVGCILGLKRTITAVGWAKFITVFRHSTFKDFHCYPSDWKGGQEHKDDILVSAFSPPHTLATASYDGEIVFWNIGSESASRRVTARAKTQKRYSVASSAAGSRQATRLSELRNSASPKSRPTSGGSASNGLEEASESSYAIISMSFLETRRSSPAAADLVTAGGNGWVRFWNSLSCTLIGEFVAHQHAGSILMAVDKENQFMATADVDGMVKTWLITDYNMAPCEEKPVNTSSPKMIAHWTPHHDGVTSMSIFYHKDKPLVVTASSDHCIVLSDIRGGIIGTFGQESAWEVLPFVAGVDDDFSNIGIPEDEDNQADLARINEDGTWSPDHRATDDPSNFKVDSWESSLLGQRYQETRKQKRERKQPGIIPNLPYLHWERTGAPPAGPYNALETMDLSEVDQLQKPDFMSNPHKFFGEKIEETVSASSRLPGLSESLRTAFDEKSLFPKYILDYENELKKVSNPHVHVQPNKRASLSHSNQQTTTPTINKKPASKGGSKLKTSHSMRTNQSIDE